LVFFSVKYIQKRKDFFDFVSFFSILTILPLYIIPMLQIVIFVPKEHLLDFFSNSEWITNSLLGKDLVNLTVLMILLSFIYLMLSVYISRKIYNILKPD